MENKLSKLNTDSAVVYDNANFQELSERVLLKSLMVWVKIRFIVPLKLTYPSYEADTIKIIDSISNNKLVAVVSDADIWTIQRNATLFNAVARAFAKHFMTPELFAEFGAISFFADYKKHEANITMNRTSFAPPGNSLLPCIMFNKPHGQILRDYKDHGFLYKSQIDIIPRLKSKREVFITPEENAIIDKAYNDFKNDPEFVQKRTDIEIARQIEEKHLAAVMKAVNRRGDQSAITKLAIAMHTIVDMSYKHDAHKVLKVTMNGHDATPIMDFTRMFVINYDIDLDFIAEILRPLVDSNIKINVGKNRILFTTQSGVDPDDPKLVELPNTLIIKDEAAFNQYFDTHVGPVTALDDVESIMQRILQHKYKDYY